MLLNILFLGAPLILGVVVGFIFGNVLTMIDVIIIAYMIMGLRLYQIHLRRQRFRKATEILHNHGRGEELMRWLEGAGVYCPEKDDGLEHRFCQVNLRTLTGFREVFPYDIAWESMAILVNSMCHLDQNTISITAERLINLYPSKKQLDKFFECMAAVGRHDKTTLRLRETTTQMLKKFKKETERSREDRILEQAFRKKGPREPGEESRNQF